MLQLWLENKNKQQTGKNAANFISNSKGKTMRKTAKEKIGKPQKMTRFQYEYFWLANNKGTKKEKYKTTICKHYHVRVHKGSSPFLILYADEI